LSRVYSSVVERIYQGRQVAGVWGWRQVRGPGRVRWSRQVMGRHARSCKGRPTAHRQRGDGAMPAAGRARVVAAKGRAPVQYAQVNSPGLPARQFAMPVECPPCLRCLRVHHASARQPVRAVCKRDVVAEEVCAAEARRDEVRAEGAQQQADCRWQASAGHMCERHVEQASPAQVCGEASRR